MLVAFGALSESTCADACFCDGMHKKKKRSVSECKTLQASTPHTTTHSYIHTRHKMCGCNTRATLVCSSSHPQSCSHLAEEQCEEQEPCRHHENLPSTRDDGTWLAFHFAPLHFLFTSTKQQLWSCAVHTVLKAKARGRRTHLWFCSSSSSSSKRTRYVRARIHQARHPLCRCARVKPSLEIQNRKNDPTHPELLYSGPLLRVELYSYNTESTTVHMQICGLVTGAESSNALEKNLGFQLPIPI